MNENNTISSHQSANFRTFTGWLKQFCVAALYMLFGYGIHYNFVAHEIENTFWPSSGVALAVLLIGGKRYIWGILLGSLTVNALINNSPLWILGATSASLIEVLVGVWLLTRRNRFVSALHNTSNYLQLIIVGGWAACLVGVSAGTLILRLTGVISSSADIGDVLHWWMRDTLGVVLITPLIFAWWQTKSERLTRNQLIEGFLLISATFVVGQIIFLGWWNSGLLLAPKGFYMFLFITWIAIRLGIRATTFTLNMIAIQALSGAYLKVGDFAGEISQYNLHNYQSFILILSIVGMTLVTYVSEIKQALATLQLKDSALNAAANSILITDIAGKIEWANQAFSELTGFSQSEIKSRNHKEILRSGKHDNSHYQGIWDTVQAGKVWHGELVSRRKDLSLYDEEMTITPLTDSRGKLAYFVAVTQEITERKQVENQLRVASVAFETQEGMMITDANGVILRVNKAFTKTTGYTAAEIVGQTPDFLKSGHHDADFYREMKENIQRTGSWQGEVWNRRKNGEVYPTWLNISTVLGENAGITHYVGTFVDITERKAADEEIKYLAFFDPLTGLPNRRLLIDRLGHALTSSARTGRKGALLFIDMDNFKTLNDSLGHEMGDLLLQQVALRLQSCAGEGAVVARLGGDEFVVILEDLSEQTLEAATQTEDMGEKILADLNHPYQLATHTYHSTPSIGVILFNSHEQPIDELLKQADIAMYQAKNQGRNTLCFFDPQMQACISARVSLEADLRLALTENQFKLHYQLQAGSKGEFIGAEVLIRWHHPERGMVSPADFIPLAEETGLIIPIGDWVLKTACAQIKVWESEPATQHLQLAVNVSARQFQQTDFVEQVRQILNETGINPELLKLELTESLLLDNVLETIGKMNTLREIGVRFSLDDFGTGYSSLAYLTRLPLDQLKIDQSFVRNIGLKTSDAVIVQTIIGMANNLGMEVIAEGVETEAQRNFLAQHDCLLCQGYLFSKPLPVAEFESLIKQKYGENLILDA